MNPFQKLAYEIQRGKMLRSKEAEPWVLALQ